MAEKTRKLTALGDNCLSYKHLLAFFLPLAVTPFFIMSIHSLMNAALARLPYPELSIAVFTVVKGIANAVKAPDAMFMQLNVSLVDDRKSFYTTSKFAWSLGGGFFAILFVLGYSPAGGWFLRNIIGLTDPEAIRFALLGLRITCFLPLAETLRNVHRGLVIGHERTRIVTAGTAVRLVMISLFLFWAVRTQLISGIVGASLAWTLGIGIEGLVVFLAVIYYFSSPGQAAEELPKKDKGSLKMAQVLSFFVPLAVMRMLWSFLQPLIQSGIARSVENPTLDLAAFGVAYGVIMLLVGPLRNLHQCSLVYVQEDDYDRWMKVMRFSLYAGGICTLLSFALFLTPAGFWIMHHIIGVSVEVASLGRMVLLALSILPLIRSIREAYWGLLMGRQATKLIGYAMGLNLSVVFLVLLLAIGPLEAAAWISPAVIGAAAFTIGQAVETLVVWYFAGDDLVPGAGKN